MDEFGYLSALLSVILGLAVTQILKGFRGLILSCARGRADDRQEQYRFLHKHLKSFRDADDFLKMFLLLDRVKHECPNRFAG